MKSNSTITKSQTAVAKPQLKVSKSASLEETLAGTYAILKKNFITPIVEDFGALPKNSKTIKKEDVEEGYQTLASILLFVIFSFIFFRIIGHLGVGVLIGLSVAIISHFMDNEETSPVQKEKTPKK